MHNVLDLEARVSRLPRNPTGDDAQVSGDANPVVQTPTTILVTLPARTDISSQAKTARNEGGICSQRSRAGDEVKYFSTEATISIEEARQELRALCP